jgi:transcriptional regulator with XRE-family HTH domain
MLGGALRRYRENLGLSLEDAARVLGCDRSKISRIETGQRGIRPEELSGLLTGYGVPDSEQAILGRLAGRGPLRGWWDQYPGIVPEAAADYLVMEAAAAEVMTYDPQLVPDLVQIPAYARAAAAARADAAGHYPDHAAAAVAARQAAFLAGTGYLWQSSARPRCARKWAGRT